MRVDIVTGVGYGDEGKGVTTHYLAERSSNSIVVRFGGGHQVGHTVTKNGYQHTHHDTGSGTLAGVPTFYSKFCTVDPLSSLLEIEKLTSDGYEPVLIYDPRAMIVTPLDIHMNRQREKEYNHGTVGVGFGQTIERNENHFRLMMHDIYNPVIFKQKCAAIATYYSKYRYSSIPFNIEDFYDACVEFSLKIELSFLKNIVSKRNISNLIFEGHQGTLLDMEYGVFPHVTRSKTTCKNVFSILEEEVIHPASVNQYMVTRAYHTRHGNGPFEEEQIDLVNNEKEYNQYNEHQGVFKKSSLQIELLRAGIIYNLLDCPRIYETINILVMTCVDQISSSEFQKVLSSLKEIPKDYIDRLMINESPESYLKHVNLYK